MSTTKGSTAGASIDHFVDIRRFCRAVAAARPISGPATDVILSEFLATVRGALARLEDATEEGAGDSEGES